MENDVSHLPSSVQTLIALIGLPLTLRMIDALGGTTLNLYRSDACVERLAATVGRDAAHAIIKFYGNTPVTVATCSKALVLVRNRDLLAKFDRLTQNEGRSARAAVTQIARDYGVHERTVWRVLNTTGEFKPVDARQMSLI
jgi:hypothetical protein